MEEEMKERISSYCSDVFLFNGLNNMGKKFANPLNNIYLCHVISLL